MPQTSSPRPDASREADDAPPGGTAPDEVRPRPVFLIGGFALLAAAVVGVFVFLGPGDQPTAALSEQAAAPGAPAPEVTASPYPAPEGPVVAGPADSPEQALGGFLTAEHARDLETSYTFLEAEDREAFGSPAGWVAAHADLFGPVTGFTLDGVDDSSGEAVVTARVSYVPGLDPVVGLTPARALVTVVAHREGDGWVLDLDTFQLEPELPSDRQAADAAERFVAAAQDCAPPTGTLIGTAGLVDRLCDASGPVEVGPPSLLDDVTIVQPFVATYGPDAQVWMRVVTVERPVPLRVVLGPLGDDWTVIGLVRAP